MAIILELDMLRERLIGSGKQNTVVLQCLPLDGVILGFRCIPPFVALLFLFLFLDGLFRFFGRISLALLGWCGNLGSLRDRLVGIGLLLFYAVRLALGGDTI